jgi:hypothetical protein
MFATETANLIPALATAASDFKQLQFGARQYAALDDPELGARRVLGCRNQLLRDARDPAYESAS